MKYNCSNVTAAPIECYFERVIFRIVISTLSCVVIVIHAIFITLILHKPKLRKANKLLLNLSLAHFLYGVFTLVQWQKPYDKISTWLVYVSYVKMNLCLLLMTSDRFVAIRYPFYYQLKFKSYQKWMIIFSWLFFLVVLSMSSIGDLPIEASLGMTFVVLFTTIILLVLNSIVYRIVLKQKKSIQMNTVTRLNQEGMFAISLCESC